MSTTTCPACLNTLIRLLPVRHGPDDEMVEDFPCPVCLPWKHGFPGETVEIKGRTHYIIEPSEPNTPAVYNGFPNV